MWWKVKKNIKLIEYVELHELLETVPKTKWKECLLYWNLGIVYCICGNFSKDSETSRDVIQSTLNFLSIQNSVIVFFTTSPPCPATAVVSTATTAAASNTQCAIATPIALIFVRASVRKSAKNISTWCQGKPEYKAFRGADGRARVGQARQQQVGWSVACVRDQRWYSWICEPSEQVDSRVCRHL